MAHRTPVWLVDGDDMQTRPRRGGPIALNGFEFQAAHALHLVTQLLTCEDGLVQLRYEGAQDVDLMLGQGRQLYIQYKEKADTEFSFDTTKDVLHGFMRDVADACGHPPNLRRLTCLKLSFLFVTTGILVGPEIVSVLRKTKTKVARLAKILAEEFVYEENPVDKLAERQRIAAYVLDNVEFEVHPRLRSKEPELMASARLAMFGVPPASIGASIAQIKSLLTPVATIFSADVAHCLHGLDDIHPASGRACISLLPSDNSFPPLPFVRQEFRDSGRATWPAIHYELDVERDATEKIEASVIALGKAGGAVLVSGPAASGKSTVVRRVGWKLHRSGAAMVFEMTNPAALDNRSWDELIRIARLTERPVIVIVDDIGSHMPVLDELKRTANAGVTILATDRNRRCLASNMPGQVFPHHLDSVSANELARLEELAGCVLGERARQRLAPHMRHGEIYAVSLIVQGFGLEELADRTLQRARSFGPAFESLFLALCACGENDQAMPMTLFSRMLPDPHMWANALEERFVFAEGIDRVRSGHAALARAIMKVSSADASTLKARLLERADSKDARERQFALALVSGINPHAAKEMAAHQDELIHFAEQVILHGEYLDLKRCAQALDVVVAAGARKLTGVIGRLKKAATSERVKSARDAVAFWNITNDFAVAYPVVAKVFASPSIADGRLPFIRWVTEQGRGHPAMQRDAVAMHFDWVRRNGFPLPETGALVACICHGELRLTDDQLEEYARVLEVLLVEMNFSPDNYVERHLLHFIAHTICTPVRSAQAFDTLLETVRRNYKPDALRYDSSLLHVLMNAAKQAGSERARLATLRLIAPLLPAFSSDDIEKLVMSMHQLLSKELKVFANDFLKNFANAKRAKILASTKKFVSEVTRYIAEAQDMDAVPRTTTSGAS